MTAQELAITPSLPPGGLAAHIRPASPPQAPPTSAAMTPADIWRIIRRRLALIAIVAIALMMIGIPLNFLWYYLGPTWSSSALLQVQYSEIPEAIGATQRLTPANIIEQFQHSTANAMRAPYFASQVIQDPRVKETDWYNKDKNNALIRFQEDLSVAPVRDSAIIRVSFATAKRKDAPIIVNRLVLVFLDEQKKQSTTELDQRISTLRTQRNTLEAELRNKNEDVEQYVREEKIDILNVAERDIEIQLGEYAKTLTEMKLGVRSVMQATEAMKGQSPESWTPTADAQYRIDNDPNVRTLTGQLLGWRQSLQALRERLGDDHPEIKKTENILRITTQDLAREKATLKQQFFEESRNGLDTALTSYEASIEQIENAIDEIRDRKNKISPKIVRFRQKEAEQRALAAKIEDYEEAVTRSEATAAALKAGGAKVILRASAIEPLQPSSPNLIVNVPATVIISTFIALALAFLLEFLDKTVRSSLCIRRHIGLPCLGTIPALEEDESNLQDTYSIVTHAPRSLLAEAFRQLRTNISFCARTETFRSILVTSPSPHDGRTTISVNLAASFALSGKKVLLVDANFKKPAFIRLFHNLPTVGLAELVSGKANADQAVVLTDTPGLSVLGSGNPDSLHAELLSGPGVKSVIDNLAARFDLVIIYGPPALLSADALLLPHTWTLCFLLPAPERTLTDNSTV